MRGATLSAVIGAAAIALAAVGARPASAQEAATPPVETTDVVSVFEATCLRFAGRAEGLRAFLRAKGAPEFAARDRALFIDDRAGVVFNTSMPSTRLAVASESNGLCSTYLGSGDGSDLVEVLHGMLQNAHIPFTRESDDRSDLRTSIAEHLRLGVNEYTLVTSVNARPGAAVRAIISLAPAAP